LTAIFKKAIHLLKPEERKRFFLFSLFDALICILDIASLAALVYIINFYMHPPTTGSFFLPATISDHHSVLLIGFFLFFFCLKNLAAYWLNKLQYGFVYKVASRLSEKKLLQYLKGPYQHYSSIDSAVHIKNISQQPVEFGHYILSGLQQIITQTILISCSVIAILLFNAALFLLLLLILLPPVILLSYFIKKSTRKFRLQAKTNSEKSLQYLKEALAGFIESKIYNRPDFFTERYADQQKQLNTYLSNLQAVQAVPARLMEVFAVAGLFVLIAISTFSGSEIITLVTVGAFMAAAYKIIPGVVKILNCSGTIRAYEYTITDLSENDMVLPVIIQEQKTISTIEFKDVSFKFRQQTILKGFNCYLQKGDMVGISGVSGRGKTTLINILLGFEGVDTGQILLNGQPVNEAARAQFWEQIAYVKQQSFLIHDTMLTNIAFNNICVDTERLEYAITAAGLNEVIAQYPEGLQKIITEHGKNISGGQRQRIAIARALYKKADLIILDEPFNELDTASENTLLLHLQELARGGKIVLLITHHKKSFLLCNKIISLDEN
jgi:ABC-type multidrug transport system fused ATPase/permease subunit